MFKKDKNIYLPDEVNVLGIPISLFNEKTQKQRIVTLTYGFVGKDGKYYVAMTGHIPSDYESGGIAIMDGISDSEPTYGVLTNVNEQDRYIRGQFVKDGDRPYCQVEFYGTCGEFGSVINLFPLSSERLKVGKPEKGKAELLTTLNGNVPKKYEIEIDGIQEISGRTIISFSADFQNKKGMSGSPIIQDGKLVGVNSGNVENMNINMGFSAKDMLLEQISGLYLKRPESVLLEGRGEREIFN